MAIAYPPTYNIQEALGYKTRHQDLTETNFKKLSTGDIIRGSIDEKASFIPYNFQALYVKPNETFVLDNWGTFLLTKISPQQTHLIIRTQEPKSASVAVLRTQCITMQQKVT